MFSGGTYAMTIERSSRVKRRRLTICAIVGAVLVVTVSVALIVLPGLRHPWRLLFPGEFVPPPPPDLSECTRLEVEYRMYPGETDWPSHLFSPEELAYLKSRETVVIEDGELIELLAHEVVRAKYEGIHPEPLGSAALMVRVFAGGGPKKTTSFQIWYGQLRTEDGHMFYNRGLPSVLAKLRPEVEPFRNRKFCALRVKSLHRRVRREMGYDYAYPTPSTWCDALKLRMKWNNHPEDQTKWAFTCSSMREPYTSHFAMNPDCHPDSSGDTVLLFETGAGWNQHGGLELFTFRNHDPEGGFVVFNNGTVQFVRTVEELEQLRWE